MSARDLERTFFCAAICSSSRSIVSISRLEALSNFFRLATSWISSSASSSPLLATASLTLLAIVNPSCFAPAYFERLAELCRIPGLRIEESSRELDLAAARDFGHALPPMPSHAIDSPHGNARLRQA